MTTADVVPPTPNGLPKDGQTHDQPTPVAQSPPPQPQLVGYPYAYSASQPGSAYPPPSHSVPNQGMYGLQQHQYQHQHQHQHQHQEPSTNGFFPPTPNTQPRAPGMYPLPTQNGQFQPAFYSPPPQPGQQQSAVNGQPPQSPPTQPQHVPGFMGPYGIWYPPPPAGLAPYPPAPNGIPPPPPQNGMPPPQLPQHAGVMPYPPPPSGYPPPGQPQQDGPTTHPHGSGEGQTQSNGEPNDQQQWPGAPPPANVNPAVAKTIPCRYFPDCRFGTACWYLHPDGTNHNASSNDPPPPQVQVQGQGPQPNGLIPQQPYFNGTLPPPVFYPPPLQHPQGTQNGTPNAPTPGSQDQTLPLRPPTQPNSPPPQSPQSQLPPQPYPPPPPGMYIPWGYYPPQAVPPPGLVSPPPPSATSHPGSPQPLPPTQIIPGPMWYPGPVPGPGVPLPSGVPMSPPQPGVGLALSPRMMVGGPPPLPHPMSPPMAVGGIGSPAMSVHAIGSPQAQARTMSPPMPPMGVVMGSPTNPPRSVFGGGGHVRRESFSSMSAVVMGAHPPHGHGHGHGHGHPHPHSHSNEEGIEGIGLSLGRRGGARFHSSAGRGPGGINNGGSMGRKPPCAFFPQGRCRNGGECRFPHIMPEGGPVNPTSPRGGYGGGFGRHGGVNGAARRPQIGSIDERFGDMSLVRCLFFCPWEFDLN